MLYVSGTCWPIICGWFWVLGIDEAFLVSVELFLVLLEFLLVDVVSFLEIAFSTSFLVSSFLVTLVLWSCSNSEVSEFNSFSFKASYLNSYLAIIALTWSA